MTVHVSLPIVGVYQSKKTRKLYFWLADVVNATNAQDGQKGVLYRSVDDGALYFRQEAEFNEKFTKTYGAVDAKPVKLDSYGHPVKANCGNGCGCLNICGDHRYGGRPG